MCSTTAWSRHTKRLWRLLEIAAPDDDEEEEDPCWPSSLPEPDPKPPPPLLLLLTALCSALISRSTASSMRSFTSCIAVTIGTQRLDRTVFCCGLGVELVGGEGKVEGEYR